VKHAGSQGACWTAATPRSRGLVLDVATSKELGRCSECASGQERVDLLSSSLK
jgi:hypothetical protein